MSLEFESARLRFVPIIIDNLADFLAVYNSNPYYLEPLEPSGRITLEQMQKGWAEVAAAPTAVMLGIYLKTDNTPLGTLIYLEQHPKYQTPYVTLLLIHGIQHRKGYGAEAFNALTEQGKMKGWSRVQLEVLTGNEPAMHFWGKQGFKAIHATTEQHTVTGASQDVMQKATELVLMERSLNEVAPC